ncbi:MAG: apolipoprotein N-acyltransferase [Azoarcus sp.]|jgi:apolipoprotein N-acyltransferase|nr:apolipoprotein N-acyltransferase [Azoarcus sp.]
MRVAARARFFVCSLSRALPAFVAGALAVPAFAPLGWFPLAFLSLAWLAGLLERAPSARAGFGSGFAWGLGTFLAGVSWLYIALERYGGMSPPLAAFAIFLFCAYLSLYPALAGVCYARWRQGGILRRAALFAALWLLSEWLRGTLLTGFPWLAIGYSQTPPSPLAAYLPVIGVYGVGGLLAFVSGLIGVLCAHSFAFPLASRRRAAAIAVAWSVFILVGGILLSRHVWVEPDGEALSISLIQTNIEQSFKWDAATFEETLSINAELAQAARGEITVLPETALTTSINWLPEGYLNQLTGIVGERGGSLVTGVFTYEAGQYQNAAVVLGAEGGQIYAKRHLVPFGEYSPPFFGWFYKLVAIPMSRQIPGATNQAPLVLSGRQIAVNICYEDVFGSELISSLPQAGLMLNLSNLAWYGDSLAQPQHLQIARVRALESGRPMLRSTNTGMTALVLPDGSVPAVLPAFTRGVLEIQVSAWRGLTPYARWGDALALGVALIILAALACFAAAPGVPRSGDN